MKIAPLMAEMHRHAEIEPMLIHTGQHYDKKMSKLFFDELGIPKPDIDLGIGSGRHGEQTGKIMIEFEKAVLELRPDLVVVVGDVNSTIACSLVAVKLGIPVAHVEAGLRSFDRDMPEEINRILTDRISALLFVTEKTGVENLKKEGIPEDKVHFVGNVMIDTLLTHLERAKGSKVLSELQVESGDYAALTLHRPSNVDSPEALGNILSALQVIQEQIRIIFPVHPRTRARIREFGFAHKVESMPNLRLTEPLGYLDFLKLTSEAKFVLTDSGGIQEESTVVNVPCLTLRENTERPVTIEQGSNILVGLDRERIIEESLKIIRGEGKRGRRPDLWDGKAAVRIVDIIVRYLGGIVIFKSRFRPL
jgi:UDP-N-acetylglucosamine 2-epimerase (non-hydrolysing)